MRAEHNHVAIIVTRNLHNRGTRIAMREQVLAGLLVLASALSPLWIALRVQHLSADYAPMGEAAALGARAWNQELRAAMPPGCEHVDIRFPVTATEVRSVHR